VGRVPVLSRVSGMHRSVGALTLALSLSVASVAGRPTERDVAYGTDNAQRLDLFTPVSKNFPVVIFVHGGSLTSGDKADADYGKVCDAFPAAGVGCANVNYRLLPAAPWPAPAEDVAAAIAWVHANISRFGGSPARIYVGGHSAGAIMSTFAALKRDWMGQRHLPADVIKGVVAVSGPYDLRQASGFVADYLPDPASRADASPLLHVAAGAPPMLVAFGSLEAPYAKGSPEFVDALVRAGVDARLIPLAGMQHDATALSLGQADGAVVRAMLALMQ